MYEGRTLHKQATSVGHLTNFSFGFLYEIFTEDSSLLFVYDGAKKSKMTKNSNQGVRQDLWFEFLVNFEFFAPWYKKVERHLLWKFYKKIRRKSRSNVPPKLLACVRFPYRVVHKIGHLRKFNRSREIEFNFLTAWTISIKFGTLVQHALGYKTLPPILLIFD